MSIGVAKVRYFLIYLELQRIREGEQNLNKFGPFPALSKQNRPKFGLSVVRPLYFLFGHFWVMRPNHRPAGKSTLDPPHNVRAIPLNSKAEARAAWVTWMGLPKRRRLALITLVKCRRPVYQSAVGRWLELIDFYCLIPQTQDWIRGWVHTLLL